MIIRDFFVDFGDFVGVGREEERGEAQCSVVQCRGERPGDTAGPCRTLIRACLPSCGWSSLSLRPRKHQDNRCVELERLGQTPTPPTPLRVLRPPPYLSPSPSWLLQPDPGRKQFTLPQWDSSPRHCSVFARIYPRFTDKAGFRCDADTIFGTSWNTFYTEQLIHARAIHYFVVFNIYYGM